MIYCILTWGVSLGWGATCSAPYVNGAGFTHKLAVSVEAIL